MESREFRSGLWRWTAPHPAWSPEADWEERVGSVYFEAADAVVLIDPLVPEHEEKTFWQALDRDVERAGLPVSVLLTVAWHTRSTREIAVRYDARVFAHEAVQSEVEKRSTTVSDPFRLDEPLPGGVRAIAAQQAGEVLFWLPAPRALVPGDVMLGTDGGARLCPPSWLPPETTLADLRDELRPLLDLPLELLLVSHGEPVTVGAHEALERALRVDGE